MEPWYRTTLNYDRNRLAEVQAIIDGEEFTTNDEEWRATRSIEAHALEDPDLLRTNLEINMVFRRADEVVGDPAIRALLNGREEVNGPPLGPSRAELVGAIS
jgi:hypothetical protein